MQALDQDGYKSPLLGNAQHYAEGHPYSALVHHDADELYFQLLCMHALIIRQTGMLLPMYAKAAFSDATYALMMEAARRLAGIPNYSQLAKLESWRVFRNFGSDHWKKRGTSVQIGRLIVNFDFNFECELEEMEKATNEQENQDDAASQLAAQARINLRTLHCKNVKHLWKSWLLNNRNPHTVERPDLAHLIKELGQFNDTYADSAYNLSHMSTMQDAMAERDERYKKMEKRKVCGGVIPEEDRFPGSCSEYSYMLPQPLTRLNYDSDEYEGLFETNFQTGYLIQLLTSTLQRLKHRINAYDLKWRLCPSPEHSLSPG